MKNLLRVFILSVLSLLFWQCGETEKATSSTPRQAFDTANVPAEQPEKKRIDLGDTEVTIATAAPLTNETVAADEWTEVLDDYDQRRSAPQTSNTVEETKEPKIVAYKDLQATAYLEDIISINQYFQYKAYENKPAPPNKNVLVFQPNWLNDNSIKTAAYPFVRAKYLSDQPVTADNLKHFPLKTEGVQPEEQFKPVIEYYEQLLNLYELVIEQPNATSFSFEAPCKELIDLRYKWAKELISAFDKAITEAHQKIVENRVVAPGQMVTVAARGFGDESLDLRDGEAQQLAAAMKNRRFDAAVTAQLMGYITDLQERTKTLQNKLATIRAGVLETSPILDEQQVAFFQAIYTNLQTFVLEQQALQKQLEELTALPLAQTSYELLLPTAEALRTNKSLAITEINQTYGIVKSVFYEKIRTLETEFHRRQAEQ